MDKRILYTCPNDEIVVIVPDANAVARRIADGMTEAEALAEIQTKAIQGAVDTGVITNITEAADINIVDVSALPDRVFRNAWRQSAGVVTEDLTASRDITHTKLTELGRLPDQAIEALLNNAADTAALRQILIDNEV